MTMKNFVERQLIINKMLELANKIQDAAFGPEEVLADLENQWRRLKRELDQLSKEDKPKMGRPSIGVTKKVSITLPATEWERIADLKENNHIESISEHFRNLHEHQYQ